MTRVALTGGIATGKSYVRVRIARRGVPTIDADTVVHGLFEPGTDVSLAIGGRFGAAALRPDGGVDRRALGGMVFGDASARRDLEALVHPQVYLAIEAWSQVQAAVGARWILADIPLLFETGRERDFDRVIVTACAPAQQIERIMRRDGVSEMAAQARLAAQWPIASKRERADDVVDTSGSFEETERQVDAICDVLDRDRPA